jgi:hypothetical protein
METTQITNRQRAEAVLNDLTHVEQINEIERLLIELDQVRLERSKAGDNYAEANNKLWKLRGDIREYFKDSFDGDKDNTIRLDLDDVNELLTNLGCEELNFTYSAKVTITFSISGVEADSEEDAENKILSAISYTINGLDYGSTDDEDYSVEDVEGE